MAASEKTFAEQYCEKEGCDYDRFLRDVFRKSLYPQARALLFVLPQSFFQSDRELIAAAGRATRLAHVRYSLKDYYWDRSRSGVIRKFGNLRVSGRRLIDVARQFLPLEESEVSR